jgi:hypothetical protein
MSWFARKLGILVGTVQTFFNAAMKGSFFCRKGATRGVRDKRSNQDWM